MRFGVRKNLAQARIELQEFRRHIELNLRDAKRIQIFARRHARNRRRSLLVYDCISHFCRHPS